MSGVAAWRRYAMAVSALALMACAQGAIDYSEFDSGEVEIDARADVTIDRARPDVLRFDVVQRDNAVPVRRDASTDGDARADARGGCASASDCRTTPDTPICDTATGRCVLCTSAQDTCPQGRYCTAEGTCGSGCRSDNDCTGAASRCDTARHVCTGCTADRDCGLGTVCQEGACVPGCNTGHGCLAPESCCGGSCLDVTSDSANCGSCGRACGAGTACCNGGCANVQSDVRNCGACGRSCTLPFATASCTAGACTVASCSAGRGNCDNNAANGCETETTDNANCGGCGTACPTGQSCYAGTCGVCPSGQTTCPSGCANLMTDARNCGSCGHACSATQSCSAGVCGTSGPTNDRCEGARELDFSNSAVVVTGTTEAAVNDSSCGAGGDVYFTFTLSRREVVYADTFGSSFDTHLAVASSCTASAGNCVDDACGSVQSQLAVVLPAGRHYLVVSGHLATHKGNFTLRVEHLPTGNGTPAVLTRGSGREVSGTTSGTGTIDGSCVRASGPEQMYYFLTCPDYRGGAVEANFCTIWPNAALADFDSVLYFRQGHGAESCNNDGCVFRRRLSRVKGDASTGAGLRALYVDGYSQSERGPYTLRYTVP